MKNSTFDYVIVGAGSAGCTLAYRLSQNPQVKVLVLEAGGWGKHPFLHIPLAWPHIFYNRMSDWNYFSEPDATIANRRLDCARGKLVGGSSSINGMTYMRGHPGDYDRWASTPGLEGWAFKNVLSLFKRAESWEGGEDEFRGGSGPLTTRYSRFNDPISENFVAAGIEAGYPFTKDFNGEEPEGFAAWQSTIRDGLRCSTAVAYMKPALERENVTLEVRAMTQRVLMDGTTAIGIEYMQDGQLRQVYASREVILAAGAINSPQLLNLSGIGASNELKDIGVKTIVDLPGVGKNLQDHISVGVTYARKDRSPLHKAMRADRIVRELGRAYFKGDGIATDLPSGGLAHIKSSPEQELPDIELLTAAAPSTAHPYFWPFVPSYSDGFMVRAAVLRPESRGHVRLSSNDPNAAPIIAQNFLANYSDREALRKGVRMVRDVGRQKSLAKIVDRELTPMGFSDAEIDAHIGAAAISVHHPVGTCKMGNSNDVNAVVDLELRVFGTRNLRVVDASIMPLIVGGGTNAPTIMIAEKASDMIAASTH
ncbi:NAD(P)-binding protein [Diaphorobacter sp. HDW4B]|uniref:GMC family oxidoreductase n=1 Tax=Diaphorobacter sp. HDW4B TaxID=2714925 RepID=UPI00140AED29|nr:GMC family oxidoreductase N-terminal domain-containing protein [Diaphorobacter sp. HDW4B]QIL69342.1 NAD(P)-binding protein [Diaphorobacter sp. HDW4B]